MGEVDTEPVVVVGPEGADGTTLLPVGAEHEVVDDELAAAVEKLLEGLRTVRRVEDVRLVDSDPRQVATLTAEFVAPERELSPLPGLFVDDKVSGGFAHRSILT